MRCNNCGWDNNPANNRCEKCNAPLKGSMIKPAGGTPLAPSAPETPSTPPPAAPASPMTGTVKGKPAEGPFLDDPGNAPPQQAPPSPNQPAQPAAAACASCGYPLNPQATACPRCNHPVGAAPATTPTAGGAPKRQVMGTVKPDYMAEQAEPASFSLQPVGRENEGEFPQRQFDGESVSLNRNNLEPDNMTITSGEQAEIFQKDGKWFITDKSALKTTFRYVSEPVELKPGDIILMGNRKFVFDS